MLTTRTAQFTGLAMAAWGIATATVASIGVEWLRRNHTPPPVIVPAQRKTGELRAVGGRAKRSTR